MSAWRLVSWSERICITLKSTCSASPEVKSPAASGTDAPAFQRFRCRFRQQQNSKSGVCRSRTLSRRIWARSAVLWSSFLARQLIAGRIFWLSYLAAPETGVLDGLGALGREGVESRPPDILPAPIGDRRRVL